MSHSRTSSRNSRVALVTGASAGLGAAIARELVARRKVSALVLTARRLDRLEALAGELKNALPSLTVQTIAADLALGQPDAARNVIGEVASRQGGLDLLFNNAGLGLPTLFADADQITHQIAVNLTAPLLLARFAVPLLAARGGVKYRQLKQAACKQTQPQSRSDPTSGVTPGFGVNIPYPRRLDKRPARSGDRARPEAPHSVFARLWETGAPTGVSSADAAMVPGEAPAFNHRFFFSTCEGAFLWRLEAPVSSPRFL